MTIPRDQMARQEGAAFRARGRGRRKGEKAYSEGLSAAKEREPAISCFSLPAPSPSAFLSHESKVIGCSGVLLQSHGNCRLRPRIRP